MKHFKLKAGMLALTLACAGAGVAMLNDGSTVRANATTSSGSFYMANGAAVCLENDFSGIRWTTTVETGYYKSLEKTIENFGTIVAPTNAFDGELTHETDLGGQNLMDIPVEYAVNASENDFTYYSVVNYDDIVIDYKAANAETTKTDEEILALAYKLELTARAYVKFTDGTYAYADVQNTSRSARQVANAADLSGELASLSDTNKAEKGKGYMVGEEHRKTTPAGEMPAVIDGENPAETVTATIPDLDDVGETYEVLVGANRVKATVSGTTVTITDATYSPEGETHVSVITQSGDIYSAPIISATKVLRTATDLDMFGVGSRYRLQNTGDGDGNKINDGEEYPNLDWSNGYVFVDENYTPVKPQTGYYVLGNDIDASNYLQPTWSSGMLLNVDSVRNYNIGFQGTLNGMGHTISGMSMGDDPENTENQEQRRYGLFDIIVDGTIKNIAFTDINYTLTDRIHNYSLAVVANGAKLENVYMHVNTLGTSTTTSALFRYAKNTTIKNSIIEMAGEDALAPNKTSSIGSVMSNTNGGFEGVTFENSYVISPTPMMSQTTVADSVYTTTVWDAENVTGATNTYTGVKRYDDVKAMKDAIETDEDIYETFNSLYWDTATNGIPEWNGQARVFVDGMFSAHDGTLINNNGANDDTLATVLGKEIVSAKQINGTALTVTDGVVAGVEPRLVKDGGYTTDVGYVTLRVQVKEGDVTVNKNVVVKAYTLVLDNGKDFAYFNFKGSATQRVFASLEDAEASKFNGYYILAQDIDVDTDEYATTDSMHTHQNIATVSGINADGAQDAFISAEDKEAGTNAIGKMRDFGLTGTFDGNGYKVIDMYLSSGGLFGSIGNYGTIKNVAFKNINLKGAQQSCSLFGLRIIDYAKISNVYIEAKYHSNSGLSALLAQNIRANTVLENVIIKPSNVPSPSSPKTDWKRGIAAPHTSNIATADRFADWSNVYFINDIAVWTTGDTVAYDAATVDGAAASATTLIEGIERYTAFENMPTTAGKYDALTDTGYFVLDANNRPVWHS